MMPSSSLSFGTELKGLLSIEMHTLCTKAHMCICVWREAQWGISYDDFKKSK